MSEPVDSRFRASRRGLLAAAGGLVATAGAAIGANAAPEKPVAKPLAPTEAFWGTHQAGIVTPAQSHCYFAAFDLTTDKRSDVIDLLRTWTNAAARMTAGQTAEPLGTDLDTPAPDSAEASGLPPSRLTLTFGFGPGLFVKE